MSGPPTSTDPGTGGAGREAIEHHYDVGRDFYRLWLDRRMVYSCALWPDGLDDDLEGAQEAKLAWHVTAAAADGAGRVLDVGCGWGAMLTYLTAERGVAHATGLTLSADQADAATSGSATSGSARPGQPVAGQVPPGRVEVRLEDWRDHAPAEPYDAIISIGAFEHFARNELSRDERRAVYRTFFDRCADWLPVGGRLSLQTIAYEDFDPDSGAVSSFFTDEIFPESALPSLSDVVVASEPRFRLVDLRSDGAHYEHTLHLWQQRLEAGRDAAAELVDRATYRRYVRYLRVSRAMFDRGVCTLYRIAFERRPGPGPVRDGTEKTGLGRGEGSDGALRAF